MTSRALGLRLAFAGGNGYPPEAYGGVQSSTHDLAQRWQKAGGHPSVLAPLYGDGLFGLSARARLKLRKDDLVTDLVMGYPVSRAWFPNDCVATFCDLFRPDVAVVQCHSTVPIARAFCASRVPVVVYLRNVEVGELDGDLSGLPATAFIANSRFTSEFYFSRYGIDPKVIPPTIERQRYATTTTEEAVTFINPVPEKGLDKVLEIAKRCPDIPFSFHESWLLDEPYLRDLRVKLQPLKNVRFRRRVKDMKAVYGKSRIVLAPSKWSEAWGRVASEAHCSGIPVIGSDRGGLPEAVGPGGVCLDYEAPIDDWVGVVREVWFSDRKHRALAEAALRYSQREEMNPERQFEAFVSIVKEAARSPVAA